MIMVVCSLHAFAFEKDGIYYHFDETISSWVYVTGGPQPYEGILEIPRTIEVVNKTYQVKGFTSSGISALSKVEAIIFHSVNMGIDKETCKKLPNLKKIAYPKNTTFTKWSSAPYASCFYPSNATVTKDKFIIDNSTIYFAPPSLSGAYTIPDGITTIEREAFSECDQLSSIDAEEDSISIGYRAFWGCDNLSSVTIYNATICNQAFVCNNLSTVTILGSIEADDSNNWNFFPKNLTTLNLGKTPKWDQQLSNLSIQKITTSPDNTGLCCVDGVVYSKDGTQLIYCSRSKSGEFSVPNSVTQINYKAFLNCTGLTSFTIGDNVTTIGDEAFSMCTGIKSLSIGDNVTQIGNMAFRMCSGIESLTIGKNVTTIGNWAFDECSGIKSLSIESNATVGTGAFQGCTGIQTLTIGEKVTRIENLAFNGANNIKELHFNPINLEYDSELYENPLFPNSIETVSIGAKVQQIPAYAFSNLSNIKTINIPNSVKAIGLRAFYGCSSLVDVTLPNDLKAIESRTFAYCSKLTTISLPTSLDSIGSAAFKDCTSLKNITFPSNLSRIGNSTFKGCTSLKELQLPSELKSIGDAAFWGCESLKWVSFPSNLSAINSSTFESCISLKELQLPSSIKTIGSSAFMGCKSLEKIILPSNISMINNSTFGGCTSLKELQLPSSLKSIGEKAFVNCRNLTLKNDEFPSQLQQIGGSAFSGCTKLKLKSTGLPTQLQQLGSHAFSKCRSLTSVVIPNGITTIQEGAFEYCSSLESISWGEKLTAIGMNAFEGCSKLNKLELNRVSTIAHNAFKGCENLLYYNISTTQTSVEINLGCGLTLDGKTPNYISQAGTYASFIPLKIGFNKKTDVIPAWYFGEVNFSLILNGKQNPLDLTAIGDTPVKTKPLVKSQLFTASSPISITTDVELYEGDAPIDSFGYTINGSSIESKSLSEVLQLEPSLDAREYSLSFYANISGIGKYTSPTEDIIVPALKLENAKATATSYTSARLLCETNLPQGTIGGFEWRRYDSPAELESAKVPCPVINGALTGSLRNLKDEIYYKCRPYYTSLGGETFYGDWFIAFTGDAGVYFEPEVETYNAHVDEEKAIVTLTGYALAGSDDITAQGFEYKKTNTLLKSSNAKWESISSPGNIMMHATLSELIPGTEYAYRAFVETGSQRFYGSVQTFTTPGEPISQLESCLMENDDVTIKAYYNLQGIRIEKPIKGINIVVFSDGTSKKIMF